MLITGLDGTIAEVTDGHRLETRATTISHVAWHAQLGKAFTWTASVDVGDDDNVIWLRNDSQDEVLVIDSVVIPD